MIYRPIYLSCDSCGIERPPTPDELRETLKQAFARARQEGWLIRSSGEMMRCPHCVALAKSARLVGKSRSRKMSIVPIS